MDRYAIILAAGKGSRMKSKRQDISKISFPILGQPLVKYVINSLKPLSLKKIVAVIGFGGAMAEPLVKEDCEVAWQKEQKGSGHAVMMTRPMLADREGETMVCVGDTPLLTSATLEAMFAAHETNKNDLTVMTAIMEEPFGYGRIVKENGLVARIVEQKDLKPSEADLKEVNAGIYIFNNLELFEALNHLTTDNAAGEYYLTDVIGLFSAKGLRVDAFPVKDVEETYGVNDRYQLAQASKIMQRRINKTLMVSGVTIEDPDTTYIAPQVTIGQDTVIRPGTFLMGNTHIGEENVVGPNCYLNDVVVGNGNEIMYSHLDETKIGDGTTLGPYLRTRKGVVIHDKAHIGNFNELKKTDFGARSKAAHLSYLGDATIGEDVNIGCGTIIANFDGVNKFPSQIEDQAFVGSGSTLISPVTLGKGSFIAAGSTINRDVPAGDMAIARQRQENKTGYAEVLHQKALERKKKTGK